MLSITTNSRIKKLLIEALLFLSLPIIFITAYINLYHQPAITFAQHLQPIGLLFLTIISFKILLFRLINPKIAQLISANLYALCLYILAAYYVLVFIGLSSWRRVVTEEFIVAYISQARSFSQVLGVSFELILGLTFLTYILLVYVYFCFLKSVNWLPSQKIISAKLFYCFVFALFLFFFYWFNHYLNSSHGNSKEPIYLTLTSGKKSSAGGFTNLTNNIDVKINRQEKLAREQYKPNKNAEHRNLVILLVDAWRPDHTSLYGYDRQTTPYLDTLQKQQLTKKLLFSHSTCGETTCAHASFFGSRYLHQLPSHLFTLQDVLKKHQYKTHFYISGDHLNFYNIRDIYGDVDDYFDGSMQKKYFFNDDMVVVDKTKKLPIWNGKPAMFHYHLLSSHNVGKKYKPFIKFKPFKNYAGIINSEPKQQFTNFYDNGVLQTDYVIQTLLETLKSKKYLDNALVLIMADHGDSLGEHGLINHTNSVYQQLLNIPTIFIPYGYETSIRSEHTGFVSIVDLAPTILHEFNMPQPASWQGNPIQLNKKTSISYFQMPPYNGFYDLTDSKNIMKYWRNENTLEEFAFNLSQDPAEQNNLFLSISSQKKQHWRATLPVLQDE